MGFSTFGNRGAHNQPMAEINTTPLVDVMLVLLVVFLITAPLFHQALAIDLPKAAATRLEDKPQVIRLALDGKGHLYWDGLAIERSTLDARLATAGTRHPELQLQADRSTHYEKLADIMAAAQRAGIVKIAFVTLPPKS